MLFISVSLSSAPHLHRLAPLYCPTCLAVSCPTCPAVSCPTCPAVSCPTCPAVSCPTCPAVSCPLSCPPPKRCSLILATTPTYALCPAAQNLMPYALRPTPYALRPTPYSLCPMPYALCPVPCALYMPYALCPTPYALCPMPYALCPVPYLCPMPYALCPTPYALRPTPYALCPMPYAAQYLMPHPTSLLHACMALTCCVVPLPLVGGARQRPACLRLHLYRLRALHTPSAAQPAGARGALVVGGHRWCADEPACLPPFCPSILPALSCVSCFDS